MRSLASYIHDYALSLNPQDGSFYMYSDLNRRLLNGDKPSMECSSLLFDNEIVGFVVGETIVYFQN